MTLRFTYDIDSKATPRFTEDLFRTSIYAPQKVKFSEAEVKVHSQSHHRQ